MSHETWKLRLLDLGVPKCVLLFLLRLQKKYFGLYEIKFNWEKIDILLLKVQNKHTTFFLNI